jgi:hypothetical protein
LSLDGKLESVKKRMNYDEFSDWFQKEYPEDRKIPSKSTFLRGWKEHFSNIKARELKDCACDVCERYRSQFNWNRITDWLRPKETN